MFFFPFINYILFAFLFAEGIISVAAWEGVQRGNTWREHKTTPLCSSLLTKASTVTLTLPSQAVLWALFSSEPEIRSTCCVHHDRRKRHVSKWLWHCKGCYCAGAESQKGKNIQCQNQIYGVMGMGGVRCKLWKKEGWKWKWKKEMEYNFVVTFEYQIYWIYLFNLIKSFDTKFIVGGWRIRFSWFKSWLHAQKVKNSGGWGAR